MPKSANLHRVIWKFPLTFAAWQRIHMPQGAQIVHVAEQNELPVIWAAAHADAPEEDRAFYIRATGEPVPENAHYLGTMHIDALVFHLFEDPDA